MLAALLALGGGCGRQAPLPADVLLIGQVAEPQTLDPHVATATNDFRIMGALYEGLVRFAPGSLTVAPGLAESWQVLEQGRRYRFFLRRGVRFHDGSPFDAEAVRFNFERMLRADHPFHDTGPFPLAFFFAAVQRIEVEGTYQLSFVLSEPFGPFLSNLAYPTGFIVSPQAVRRWGRDYGRHPAGTGAFRFVRWESRRLVELERNPDYWQEPARLARVIFRPLTDVNARSTEMLAGNLDLMMDPPPALLGVFDRAPGVTVYAQPGPHLWFLILNTRIPPFDDRRARLAVNYAVDKVQLVRQVLQGAASVAAGPVPNAFAWATDKDLKPYPHDPARARELLAASGYHGAPLVLYVPDSGSGMLAPQAMAAAIQADLRAVGMAVRIESYEWNTYLSKVNRGLDERAHLAEMAWITNDPDTLPYLTLRRAAWPEQGGFNSGYFADAELDRLLERARRSSDHQERSRLYRRIDRRVHDLAPWLFVASAKQLVVARDAVQGFALQPSYLLDLRHVLKRTVPEP